MLSYSITGIDDALARIAKLASLSGLESELEATGDAIVTEARVEPPERPQQKYVRSHRLSGSWRRTDARRGGGVIEVDVQNEMEYAPVVQGEDQAPIHRGRWKRLKAIGEEQRSAYRARAAVWAQRTWRGA